MFYHLYFNCFMILTVALGVLKGNFKKYMIIICLNEYSFLSFSHVN